MIIIYFSGENLYSIGIMLIGNFQNVAPTNKQMDALKMLLADGVVKGKLGSNYVIYAQNYFYPSYISPGQKVIDIIKTWPHYVKQFW